MLMVFKQNKHGPWRCHQFQLYNWYKTLQYNTS